MTIICISNLKYIFTSTSGWVSTSRWIITAMQCFIVCSSVTDEGSDICTTLLERTQPITTSIRIIFTRVLTVLCVSSGAQTMPIVPREPVVFVTGAAHVTKVRWTTHHNAAFVRTASSILPKAQDQFIRHCPLDISSPAVLSARFVDNLKLKCKSVG